MDAAGEGPVMAVIDKRLRTLHKRYNRITKNEDAFSLGKILDKQQEAALRSKPSLVVRIEELENLRNSLSAAVSEKISFATQHYPASSMSTCSNILLGRKQKREGEDLQTSPILKKHKEKKDTNIGVAVQSNLISDKEETLEGLDDEIIEGKTVYVDGLSRETNISDIIDFFKDVGQVVRVQLAIDRLFQLTRDGFVEFASAEQANKAVEKKKGEYLLDSQISLHLATVNHPPPRFCIDHKVWYDESLPIREDHEKPSRFVERVLLVANLSPQTNYIFPIINFFKDVGKIISVRLIVNHEGRHVGYGFVEFSSADEAKWALEEKNGEYLLDHKIMLMRLNAPPPAYFKVVTVKKKMLFVDGLSLQTKISQIIDFFKDVGQVVHVRLLVDIEGRHVGSGFVEFASADEANEALEKKKGECLDGCEIFLDVLNRDQYPYESRHSIDHKVWNKENEAVEGLDETYRFLFSSKYEVAVRKNTVFYAGTFFFEVGEDVFKFFSKAGKVVRIRLIVDEWGEYMGCGYVQFASANEAEKAVKERDNAHTMIVQMAVMEPYPFRPKYNLVEKLWYEDNLRQKSVGFTKQKVQQRDPVKQIQFLGKKTVF